MTVSKNIDFTLFRALVSIIAISLACMLSKASAMVGRVETNLPSTVDLKVESKFCPIPYSTNYCSEKFDFNGQCSGLNNVLYPILKDPFLSAGAKPFCESPSHVSKPHKES